MARDTSWNGLTNDFGLKMSDIGKVIREIFLGAYEVGETPEPIFVWGQPGVGKTQITYAAGRMIAKALGIEVEVYCQATSCMEPTDVSGVPFPVEVAGETAFTRFCGSEWAWKCSKEYEQAERKRLNKPKWNAPPALLFFDDLVAAHFQTQTAFFKGVNEGKWGDLNARPNVMVIGCGNRTEDNAGANDMPTALGNRFLHLYAKPDYKDWVEWAQNEGDISPLVVGYIRKQPGDLNVFDSDVANGTEKAWASARTWEMVSNTINRDRFPHETSPLFRNVVVGFLGAGIATKFMGFLRNTNALVAPELIIANPDKAKIPRAIDSLYATTAALEKHVVDNPETWEPALKYALRENMPQDFGVQIAVKIVKVISNLLSADERNAAFGTDTFAEMGDRYEDALTVMMEVA